ncbi:MAG TPA: DUF1282 domain-containing protein [Candidatus Aminicenantes bacterium]|nr:DUF1282 domain-containing protein [Candidatus Aminicenantes bacterium]
MDLVSRAQGIILNPKKAWETIKSEDIQVKDLFTSYAMILAAIPAIAHFIGLGLVGRNIPFVGWYRYGLGSAFLYMLLSYIFSLVSVLIVGFIINALAPTFGSTQNLNKAMALAVYCMTPYWVAGILYIIPFLGILVFLAGFYGLYILYLGFAQGMLDTPKEKVIGFFIVSLVVTIVILLIVSFILGGIFAVGAVSGAY